MSVMTTPHLDRIREYPVLRDVPWRDGQEISQTVIDAGSRVQQKGALLMATRGEVQREPCTHCAAGNGRFYLCIAQPGFYQGACASCVFPSKGAYCSLRFDQSSVAEPQDEKPGKSSADTPETRALTKRKRRSTVKILENATGSAAHAAAPSKSTDEDAELAKAQDAEEDLNPIEYLNVVQKRHKNDHHAPAPILPPVQRLPAPYNGGYTTTNPHYARPKVAQAQAQSQHESSRPKPPSQHESWTAQSSSKSEARLPPPTAQHTAGRTTSFTPVSAPAPAPAPTPAPALAPDPDQKRDSMSKDRAFPVIDSLPKAKQRQIYSVVSGLQGGIDHLDKQLRGLKALLGIPTDDASD